MFTAPRRWISPAGGIRSRVSAQAFGDPRLFHAGVRVWLAWCEDHGDIPRDRGRISHGRDVQASFFPMLHEGKPGLEWWVVEKSGEGMEPPADIGAHLRAITARFADPLPKLFSRTDLETQCFRREIYNRPSLERCNESCSMLSLAPHEPMPRS